MQSTVGFSYGSMQWEVELGVGCCGMSFGVLLKLFTSRNFSSWLIRQHPPPPPNCSQHEYSTGSIKYNIA